MATSIQIKFWSLLDILIPWYVLFVLLTSPCWPIENVTKTCLLSYSKKEVSVKFQILSHFHINSLLRLGLGFSGDYFPNCRNVILSNLRFVSLFVHGESLIDRSAFFGIAIGSQWCLFTRLWVSFTRFSKERSSSLVAVGRTGPCRHPDFSLASGVWVAELILPVCPSDSGLPPERAICFCFIFRLERGRASAMKVSTRWEKENLFPKGSIFKWRHSLSWFDHLLGQKNRWNMEIQQRTYSYYFFRWEFQPVTLEKNLHVRNINEASVTTVITTMAEINKPLLLTLRETPALIKKVEEAEWHQYEYCQFHQNPEAEGLNWMEKKIL